MIPRICIYLISLTILKVAQNICVAVIFIFLDLRYLVCMIVNMLRFPLSFLMYSCLLSFFIIHLCEGTIRWHIEMSNEVLLNKFKVTKLQKPLCCVFYFSTLVQFNCLFPYPSCLSLHHFVAEWYVPSKIFLPSTKVRLNILLYLVQMSSIMLELKLFSHTV